MYLTMKTINTLNLSGNGNIHIKDDKLISTGKLRYTLKGDTLTVKSMPSRSTQITGGTGWLSSMFGGNVVVNSSVGNTSIINNTVHTGGFEIEAVNGNLDIRGVTDNSKVVIEGVDVTKEVVALLKEKRVIKSDADLRSEKQYTLPSDTTWSLDNINVSGQVSLSVKGDYLDLKNFTCTSIGQSSIKISGAVFQTVHATSSGQSNVRFVDNCVADTAHLDSSGQSDVRGLHCKKSVVAQSSGQSDIKATADGSCKVRESSSGQSNCKIRSM
jgi:hypothetical protein